jgi:hypothetical protein
MQAHEPLSKAKSLRAQSTARYIVGHKKLPLPGFGNPLRVDAVLNVLSLSRNPRRRPNASIGPLPLIWSSRGTHRGACGPGPTGQTELKRRTREGSLSIGPASRPAGGEDR